MIRLQVADIVVTNQIEAYHYIGDDGHLACQVFNPIGVRTIDGREFFLPQGKKVLTEDGYIFYRERYAATDAFMNRIREKGIDPDFWVEVERPNLEELWGAEAAWREMEAEYA